MQTILYYALAWPFIFVCSVAEYIVWGTPSERRKIAQRNTSTQSSYWMERAREQARQLRELDYNSRCKIEELENKLRDVEKARSDR